MIDDGEAQLLKLSLDGGPIFLSVRDLPGTSRLPGDEVEISAREPKLEQVLDGVAIFAQEVVQRLKAADATRISVEFGCEIAIESGTLVAIIGKASARSTLKIGLDWTSSGP